MSLPQLPHRGSEKRGEISRPNPIGKHIQVLQQNPPDSCRGRRCPAWQLWATGGREHPQQNNPLFDHLVSAAKERLRKAEAECLRGLQVDE